MKPDIRFHSLEILNQLETTIGLCLMVDGSFSRPLSILHGNTIGMHIRHILEFFQSVDAATDHHELNYDLRKRNMLLQTDPLFALEVLQNLQEGLEGIKDRTIVLKMDYGYGLCEVKTTVFRELAYNIEHTVHHLALIKIALEAHFPEIECPQNLGIAYSTQQFQKAG
jgi:hypothetical protein